VFPPVDTRSVRDLPTSGRERMVISIGQFRPEKDHALQLRSFAKLLEMHDGAMRESGVTLAMIGSCRGADDARRVDELRSLAGELGIGDRVEFVLNEPYSVVREYLRRASVGLHTMWNEHFGIGVVVIGRGGCADRMPGEHRGGVRGNDVRDIQEGRIVVGRRRVEGCEGGR